MTIDTYSEDFRLKCLAEFWISRPRANAKAWLDKQPVEFREDMRQRMNGAMENKRGKMR